MPWLERSTVDHDTHWGTVARGQVSTVCAISFRVAWGRAAAPPGLPQLCPACAAGRVGAGGLRVWLYSSADYQVHWCDTPRDQAEVIARCGHLMCLPSVVVAHDSAPPGVCVACESLERLDRVVRVLEELKGDPTGARDPARPPVEEVGRVCPTPRPPAAPGGRAVPPDGEGMGW